MSRIHRKRSFNNNKEGESVSALPSDFTFRGIKSTWTQFENNVQGFIQDDSKNGGTKAVKFLFENDWDTPAWETRVVPPPLVDDGDDEIEIATKKSTESKNIMKKSIKLKLYAWQLYVIIAVNPYEEHYYNFAVIQSIHGII